MDTPDSGDLKRKRGRPSKKNGLANPLEVVQAEATASADDPPISNRVSGGMSLRPNRRVDVFKHMKELNRMIEQDGDADSDTELGKQLLYEPDTDEEMSDAAGHTQPSGTHRPCVLSSLSPSDASSQDIIGSLRRGKRRIAFAQGVHSPVKVSQMEVDGDKTSADAAFSSSSKSILQLINSICVGCSREMEPDTGYNVHTDCTENGTRLMDMLVMLLESPWVPESGNALCSRCVQALNQIERAYFHFRGLVDSFLDNYLLGQKMLDKDLTCSQSAEDRLGLDFTQCAVKIVENEVLSDLIDGINATDLSFNCIQTYEGQLVADTSDQLTLMPAEPNPDDLPVMLLFTENDYSTFEGTQIERTVFFTKLHLLQVNPVVVVAALSDVISASVLPGLPRPKVLLLCGGLATVWMQQKSGNGSEEDRFFCAKCDVAFRFFYQALSHVEVKHMPASEEEVSEVVAGTEQSEREQPTLDKPFQCQECFKCFTVYQNLSMHSDHYHGFKRKCNVDQCDKTCGSIMEFVQHYVNHGDSTIIMPDDFKEKRNCLLPCPLCAIRVRGVWKLYQHSFVHDDEPRFKCPVCPKRIHKVQNFKEHLLRHKSLPLSKLKMCPFCKEDFLASELSAHMKKAHKSSRHVCDMCNQVFCNEAKLAFHQEVHLPKQFWQARCDTCDSLFPSDTRLKLHIVNTHTCPNLQCSDCPEIFQNRNALHQHVKEQHRDSIAIFRCSLCGTKETNLMAAFHHYRDQHPEQPFVCYFCKQAYDSEQLLHRHLTHSHSQSVGKAPMAEDVMADYPCSFCNKIFSNGKTRLQHMRFLHLVDALTSDKITPGTDYIEQLDKSNGSVLFYHTVP